MQQLTQIISMLKDSVPDSFKWPLMGVGFLFLFAGALSALLRIFSHLENPVMRRGLHAVARTANGMMLGIVEASKPSRPLPLPKWHGRLVQVLLHLIVMLGCAGMSVVMAALAVQLFIVVIDHPALQLWALFIAMGLTAVLVLASWISARKALDCLFALWRKA